MLADRPWLAFYGEVPPSLQYPDRTLYQALHATVERFPDAPASEFFGRTSTYRDFLVVDPSASPQHSRRSQPRKRAA